MSHQPPHLISHHRLLTAESTRHGGVSPTPYASLNLGWNTGDKPKNVRENRRRFLQSLETTPERLVESHQVHGREVLHARQPGRAHGYDAIITQTPDLPIGVFTADCCPILLYDGRQHAIAAIHAGWRGTAQQIAIHTLQAMQQAFGTRPADCYAYIGTCITAPHYEVDDEVASHFPDHCRTPRSTPGKWLLDLKAANHQQLTGTGLPASSITLSPRCTWADNDRYFSHRREEGRTGRLLTVIMLKE